MIDISDEKIKEFIALFDGDISAAHEALGRYQQKDRAASPVISHHAPLSDEVVISVQNLSKRYRRGRQTVDVLRDISFSVNKGEFVAITGASGSGKSTLLQLIGGLDKPTSGSITIDGVDINKLRDGKLSEFRNKTIGFVFQFFYLQPFLKLGLNAELPAMFAHRKRKERRPETKRLLASVNLSDRIEHYPKELSGGQMQRAAIARALLNNPKILLADEPTGNLDSINSQEVVDLFHRIRGERGTTIIVVTHNPDIAAGADREITLSDGVIL